MDLLTETLTTSDLASLEKFAEWVNKPTNRRLIPTAPPGLLEGSPVNGQNLNDAESIAEVREIADGLLESTHPDLNQVALNLFPMIVSGGEARWLETRCESNDYTRKMWAAFVAALTEYHKPPLFWRSDWNLGVDDEQPSPQASQLVTAIVHGTFAGNEDWWRDIPGQRNFWAYVQSVTGDCVGGGREFRWSGGVTDSDRIQGAIRFVNWWNQEDRPRLRIIAHSHGANVVWIATTLEPRLKIESMFALGTPICFEYALRLKQIGRIENVYSRYDLTQIGGAWWTGPRGEGRTLPDSLQVTNHHVPFWSPKTSVRAVGHSDLHVEDVWANNNLYRLL